MNAPQPRLRADHRENLHLAAVLIMLASASLSIAVSQIALGLALCMLLVRRILDHRPLPSTRLGVLTLALAGWALLNIPMSNDPAQSMLYYRRFYLFAAIWAVAAVADTDGRRRWLLLAMVSGSASMSLIGLIRIFRETGSFWIIRLDTLSNPMTSGSLLMMVLLVISGFLLTPRHSRGFRLSLALAALPIGFGLMQTMTRSAWLGTVTGLGIMLLLARPRIFLPLAAALIAGIMILPRLPDDSLSGRLSERLDLPGLLQQKNSQARLAAWNVGLKMIKERPWLGYGDHDLAETSSRFYDDPDTDTIFLGHLHNNQIMLAVIWGIPGLLCANALFVWQLILVLRIWRIRGGSPSRASPHVRGWALGAIGVWVGFFMAGLTEWYFGDAESMLLYLAIIGAALGSGPALPAKKASTPDLVA